MRKQKRFSTKLLHLLLSKRIKGRLCVPYDLISKDVDRKQDGGSTKKSYSSYNTAVSKPVKTGMPEEVKKAEADKKAEKESLQRENIINEGKKRDVSFRQGKCL